MAVKLEFKADIMDEQGVKRALRRVAHEIIENNRGVEGLTLVGIQRRGVVLARMLQDLAYGRLENEFHNWQPGPEDIAVCVGREGILICRDADDSLHLPTVAEVAAWENGSWCSCLRPTCPLLSSPW